MSSYFRAGLLVTMMAVGATVATTAVSSVAFSGVAFANDKGPFSARVRNACKNDYSRFCPNYNLYSHELRRCMQAAGKAISKGCVRALVDAGEVPRSMLK